MNEPTDGARFRSGNAQGGMRLRGSAVVRLIAFQDKVMETGSLEHIKNVVEHGAYRAAACFQNFAFDVGRVSHKGAGATAEVRALMTKAFHPLLG
jgi:hypothetical protein